MNHSRLMSCLILLAAWAVCLPGCGGSNDAGAGGSGAVDPNKPVNEVKAEAASLHVDDLRAMALKYKDAFLTAKDDLASIAAKLKDIPLAEKLGAEGAKLTAELANLTAALKPLGERFKVYYDQLKAKSGDLTGLVPDLGL